MWAGTWALPPGLHAKSMKGDFSNQISGALPISTVDPKNHMAPGRIRIGDHEIFFFSEMTPCAIISGLSIVF